MKKVLKIVLILAVILLALGISVSAASVSAEVSAAVFCGSSFISEEEPALSPHDIITDDSIIDDRIKKLICFFIFSTCYA